jgi:hypothetical protein
MQLSGQIRSVISIAINKKTKENPALAGIRGIGSQAAFALMARVAQLDDRGAPCGLGCGQSSETYFG